MKTNTDIKEPPKETPIRILVCVWWLSTIVIVNIYLGILFAQLVVPRQPRSIETLEELVSQDEVRWCVTRGSALDELFRRSTPETIYGQLASRMLNVSSADEGVERVRSSGWAFIRERSMLEFKVSSTPTPTSTSTSTLTFIFTVTFAVIVTFTSTFASAFAWAQ